MAMGADQRELGDLLVEAPGDRATMGIGGKEPVGMQPEQGVGRSHLPIVVPGVCPRNQQAPTLREKP